MSLIIYCLNLTITYVLCLSIECDGIDVTVFFMSIDTALVPLESSLHGLERRKLRNITKRDLQAAIKYGTKTRGHPCQLTGDIRWKYEFADVIYITDSSSEREITSYVKPITLPMLKLEQADRIKFEVHQRLAQNNPQVCTSHTVLVIGFKNFNNVDQSASMKTCDVENFKTRSDAVYGHIALEFITMQLESGASYTDVVSIVEMRDSASIVIDRGPVCKYLYNKIVSLQQYSKPFGHGNYVPAIATVENLLAPELNNSQCACVVLFLSDGQPSDYSTGYSRVNICSFSEDLCDRLEKFANGFGRQLTFGCVGFTNGKIDLPFLKLMADSVTKGGSKGVYFHSQLDSASLIQSLTHLSMSLLQTKMRMTMLEPSVAKISQKVKWELQNFDGENSNIYDEGWIRYLDDTELWEYIPDSNPDYFNWSPRKRLHKNAVGFAKRERIFGQGAERIVYELREIGVVNKELKFVGERLVAKDNRFYNPNPSALSNMKFHTGFAKTQFKASKIAEEFNCLVASIMKRNVRIVFLKCYCYVYGGDGYLVEKLIDSEKYCKWNDNKGSVLNSKNFKNISLRGDDFDASEFLQAFSHWSFRKSNRRNLLCDLQGVLTQNATGVLFELTDPVIHHDSKADTKRKFGLTDHGKVGIRNFFKSHSCSSTCKLLGLGSES